MNRHRDEPQGVERRPSSTGHGDAAIQELQGAPRSPGSLRHSPSGRTGVFRRPMARNDDRGATGAQFILAPAFLASLLFVPAGTNE